MPQAVCEFCKKAIGDKEYLAITRSNEQDLEKREGARICFDCAKKLYPDLYRDFYPEVSEDDSKRL